VCSGYVAPSCSAVTINGTSCDGSTTCTFGSPASLADGEQVSITWDKGSIPAGAFYQLEFTEASGVVIRTELMDATHDDLTDNGTSFTYSNVNITLESGEAFEVKIRVFNASTGGASNILATQSGTDLTYMASP